MRRFSKPWPPTNVSPDNQEPRSFLDAEREYLAALPAATDRGSFARGEFDRLDKGKLREVMYREQRSICAYCELRISEEHPAPRIDHWRPLSQENDLALHWKNLYLSCPTAETCDDAKGARPLKWDKDDPDLPWPVDFAYENRLGFTSRGDMYVRRDVVIDDATRNALRLAIEDQPEGSGTRRTILNLSHPALVAARAAAIDSERTRLERDFPGTTATRAEREERANALLAKNPLPPFVSIRAAWLRKTLGRGR
ncbi:MAG: hypothetical protein GY842_26220 [bacterium]|nr:hypothetical protein [bacterium]